MITNSYHGLIETGEFKYIHVNHLVTWGKGQTHFIKNNDGIENIHYVGCYVLSYYEKQKRESLLALFEEADEKKKSIVFFDNKVLKNASTPESLCFKYYELIIEVAERFDVNVFFRTKDHNIFSQKIF